MRKVYEEEMMYDSELRKTVRKELLRTRKNDVKNRQKMRKAARAAKHNYIIEIEEDD